MSKAAISWFVAGGDADSGLACGSLVSSKATEIEPVEELVSVSTTQ